MHKFTFSILLSTSILFSNELVDAISDNNLQFFRAKKESLKEINSCLIAGDITPLMIAAAYGNAKTAGILISKGADVYIRDSSKQTARELAAKKDKKEVLAVMDKFRR